MLRRDELNRYLDDLLETARFDDYAPNGLQVEGAEHISTLVTGVTASRALVDAALQAGAEALLVHHGYFWRGEDPRIVGMTRARLAPLLAHDINLFAYHLPLDAHAAYGNNVQLARVLELSVLGRFGPSPQLGLYGMTAAPVHQPTFRMSCAPPATASGARASRRSRWLATSSTVIGAAVMPYSPSCGDGPKRPSTDNSSTRASCTLLP